MTHGENKLYMPKYSLNILDVFSKTCFWRVIRNYPGTNDYSLSSLNAHIYVFLNFLNTYNEHYSEFTTPFNLGKEVWVHKKQKWNGNLWSLREYALIKGIQCKDMSKVSSPVQQSPCGTGVKPGKSTDTSLNYGKLAFYKILVILNIVEE